MTMWIVHRSITEINVVRRVGRWREKQLRPPQLELLVQPLDLLPALLKNLQPLPKLQLLLLGKQSFLHTFYSEILERKAVNHTYIFIPEYIFLCFSFFLSLFMRSIIFFLFISGPPPLPQPHQRPQPPPPLHG